MIDRTFEKRERERERERLILFVDEARTKSDGRRRESVVPNQLKDTEIE
jgi:hypothetical protein